MKLTSTASIQRIAYSTSAIGEPVESVTTASSGVACILETVTGDEHVILGARGVDITHLLICKPADVTEKDRVTIAGTTYEVTLVDNVHSLGRHMEIYLKELRDVR